MREANDRRLRYLRAGNEGGLYLGGADAVAGRVDNVIDTAGDPVVALAVSSAAITGEVVSCEQVGESQMEARRKQLDRWSTKADQSVDEDQRTNIIGR